MRFEYSFFVEIYIAIAAFIIPVEKRNKFAIKLILPAMLLVLIEKTIENTHISSTIETTLLASIMGNIIYFGVAIIAVWLIVITSCKIVVKEATFIVFMAYALQHISFSIRYFVEGITEGQIMNDNIVVYMLSHILVAIASYILFAKPMAKDRHYKIEALQSTWTGITVLFVVLVMSTVADKYHFRFVHSIYTTLCCILILVSARSQMTLRYEREAHELIEAIWAKKRMQYELSKDAMNLVNQHYHDIKHKIAAINLIQNEQERKSALEKIEENIAVYDTVVRTDNEILDTILTEKRIICEKENISMSCICDGTSLLFMDGLDLYTLLGNALDNAIEANEKLPEEKRFLTIRIQTVKGITVIEMINPYDKHPEIVNGKIVTSKIAKDEHGFGIKSMEEITAKYDGIIDYKFENKSFMLKIIFH